MVCILLLLLIQFRVLIGEDKIVHRYRFKIFLNEKPIRGLPIILKREMRPRRLKFTIHEKEAKDKNKE